MGFMLGVMLCMAVDLFGVVVRGRGAGEPVGGSADDDCGGDDGEEFHSFIH